MNRAELEEYHRVNLKNSIVRSSKFYKEIHEVKAMYEKLHELGAGAPENSAFYRAIVWMIQRIDEDTPKPEGYNTES